MDYRRLSLYPFRKEVQEWIGEEGVSLDEVLTDPIFKQTVEEGLSRVQESMTEDGIRERDAHNRVKALRLVLSYPIARMLVSIVGDILLIRRYALREAEAAYKSFKKEDMEFLLDIGNGELNLPVASEDGEVFKVHFTNYLKNASEIRDRDWKLYNQDLNNGMICLEKEKFARLLQEALRKQIESELPLEVNEQIIDALKEEVDEVVKGVEILRSAIQKESYGEFSMEYLPPCMGELLGKIQGGINIPHVARFALTAFLYAVGLDADDIIDLFRVSPDFKEDIASYQVRHIGGEISGTRYTPPSCGTMVTYGICVRDRSCEGMGHPLRYYYRRQRRAERESGKAPPAPETKAEGASKGEVEADGG